MTDSIANLILDHYPRKEDRMTGRKAVLKAMKLVQKEDGICLLETAELFLRAVVKYSQHRAYIESKKDGSFVPEIPLSATFFNKGRYRDVEVWEQAPKEKDKIPNVQWASEVWDKLVYGPYSIKWNDPRYWEGENHWNNIWNNLPAAVRADLMHNWKTDQ